MTKEKANRNEVVGMFLTYCRKTLVNARTDVLRERKRRRNREVLFCDLRRSELDTRFGSPSYAEEELVAELGSLFLSADLGIQSTDLEGEFYENHVSYLQSWMNALENDPSYLFKAASKADHADTFIMERYEEELGKNIEIDAPELEEEVSLAGESHDMASASEHQPESEMPENVLSTVL